MNSDMIEKHENLINFDGVQAYDFESNQSNSKARLKKQSSFPKMCDYAFGPKCLGNSVCKFNF